MEKKSNKEKSYLTANYYGKDISTKEMVNQIVEKIMLESSCEEPVHRKHCDGCLHFHSDKCLIDNKEIYPGTGIYEDKICENYERRYNPCGKCKHHKNLICRNTKSGDCGSYKHYYEGCPYHESKKT